MMFVVVSLVLHCRQLLAEDRQRLAGHAERVLSNAEPSDDSLPADVCDMVAALVSRRRAQRGYATGEGG
jgi:hypothetical protein